MSPIITVITPYLNAQNHINDYISMLQRQSLSNWCAILIDDGSVDKSTDCLYELSKLDQRFTLLTRPGSKPLNSGPAAARNFGIKHVTTPLVAFCDIDDIWHPDKLLIQTRYHQTNLLELSVTSYAKFDFISQAILDIQTPPPTLTSRSFTSRNPIPMLTVIVNHSLILNGMPECKHEDYAMWCNIFNSRSNVRYGCIQQVLAFYKLHPANLTRNRLLMPIWTYDVYRVLGNNRLLSILRLIRWMYFHLITILRNTLLPPRLNLSLVELLERPPLRSTQVLKS